MSPPNICFIMLSCYLHGLKGFQLTTCALYATDCIPTEIKGCKRNNQGCATAGIEGLPQHNKQYTYIVYEKSCQQIILHMQGCRGVAPRYDEAASVQLRAVLYAARHILAEAMGGLPDSRTGKDLLPLLLQGAVLPKKQRLVDFSRFHTATLWLGPTLAAAGMLHLPRLA